MDEVLHNLPNDREGNAPALLVSELVDCRRDFLEIRPRVGWLDHHHARRRGGIVIDRYSRRIVHLVDGLRFRGGLFARHGGRFLDKWIEVARQHSPFHPTFDS